MGVSTRLVQRAAALAFALIMTVVLTSVILSLTGYDEKVYKAIIDQEVRVYQQSLQRSGNFTEAQIRAAVELYKQQLISIYGLDKPPAQRAILNVRNILTLNLGYAVSQDTCSVAVLPFPCRVADAIYAVIPRSIILVTVSELICVVIALNVAPLMAYRRGKLLDRSIVTYAALFNAIPLWWLAMVFLMVFSSQLQLAPTSHMGVVKAISDLASRPSIESLSGLLYYMWLPVFVTTISFLGGWLYSVRAMVLRVSAEDFVVTAKAKGLSDSEVARRHILRAALPPVITSVVLALATSIFGGFMITEAVFDWPGMGMLFRVAIMNADAPTVLGLIFMSTAVYVAARFLLEVLYIILDPRVRL